MYPMHGCNKGAMMKKFSLRTMSNASGNPPFPAEGRFTSGPALVGYLAVIKLGLHLATASVYGFFIDELYFLACGEHLAWGYVDFPPLTAFQAWLTRALFGDSPYSIRLFPALAGAGLVLVAGALARRLGGGRFSQVLAAVCVLVAPVYLAFSTYLSMNPIDALVWAGLAYLALRLAQDGDPRLWIPFGLLAGIGLLNKHTVVFFGFSVVVGLLLTRQRRLLASRWLLVGGTIALIVALPNLVWEIRHGFPHGEGPQSGKAACVGLSDHSDLPVRDHSGFAQDILRRLGLPDSDRRRGGAA
jgi:hypothetical protein